MTLSNLDIDSVLGDLRETLEVEIKQWIVLGRSENKAMIAKEVIPDKPQREGALAHLAFVTVSALAPL